MPLIQLAERSLLPDALIRLGIRGLLRVRRQTLRADDAGGQAERLETFVRQLRESPLAVDTAAANRQHYEVPAEFFEFVLGPLLKYSCCRFPSPSASLGEAEQAMLRETCERAEILDGQRILELGCGWGSLTLWLAEHFPGCEITAVSNSTTQRRFIEERVRARGFGKVQVITADMRDFSSAETFDRVISVEMFEHMRNYELLLGKVSSWLTPQGKLFVHIFCHQDTPYLFEAEGSSNWMGRHFFTGGMMPSADLFRQFDQHLEVEQQWRVNGIEYWRTCERWLDNLDSNRAKILRCFQRDLPTSEARICLQRWRIFFMTCAELFRYGGGNEWFVAHYRFRQQHRTLHDGKTASQAMEPTLT